MPTLPTPTTPPALPPSRLRAPESPPPAQPQSLLSTSRPYTHCPGGALDLPLEDSMEDMAPINAPTGSELPNARMRSESMGACHCLQARSRVARTTRPNPLVLVPLSLHPAPWPGLKMGVSGLRAAEPRDFVSTCGSFPSNRLRSSCNL